MNILMIVTGDSSYDARVINERDALRDDGHSVNILDWKDKPDDKILWIFALLKWYYVSYKALKMINNYDVVHCHDFDTLFLGILLKKYFHIKLVYDSHESYALMTNISLVLPFEKLFISNVDRFISVSEAVSKYLRSLGGSDIVIIENCKHIVMEEYIPTDNNIFTVTYIGTLSKLRMFPELVDSIGGLSGVHFIVGGYGQCYNEVKERSLIYDNVDFIGTVPTYKVIEYTKNSDLIICMLNSSNRNCVIGTPNKIFEGMVCGRPILVTDKTDIATFVSDEKIGFISKYSTEDIRDTISHLSSNNDIVEQYGRNAFLLGETKNWEIEQKKLVKLYKEK